MTPEIISFEDIQLAKIEKLPIAEITNYNSDYWRRKVREVIEQISAKGIPVKLIGSNYKDETARSAVLKLYEKLAEVDKDIAIGDLPSAQVIQFESQKSPH